MSDRDRTYLRGQLASVGILLDDPIAKPDIAPAKPAPAPIDRGQIRRILVSRGAPERSLRWLTISCPSLEAAMAYNPPEEP